MKNVFLARNERAVKAQVQLSMPTPFIICLEVIKIIKRSGANEENINKEKLMLIEKAELNAIKSLSYVARIKGIPAESEAHRICSYVLIDPDCEMRDCN